MTFQIDATQAISGIDIPIAELGITVKQPKIKEIAMLGEELYFIALSIFKTTPAQLNIVNPHITSWQVFQESLKQKIDGVKNVRTLIGNFLQLFFIEKVIIGPNSIILNKSDGMTNIEPDVFDFFQLIISTIGGKDLLTPATEQFKPKNKRAAEIAAKMLKARKRLAAQQPQSKSDSFIAKYVKIVSIGTSNSLEQVTNMTLLQLNELTQTYLAWEQYDIDIKSRLAGAKSDDKIVHWTARNSQKENDTIGTI